jgi:hypothetical protein
MTTETGGPAFPVRLPIIGAIYACDEPVPSEIHGGMSLRDYFAAKAMEGVLASGNLPKFTPDLDVAECSYRLADAMLERRKT